MKGKNAIIGIVIVVGLLVLPIPSVSSIFYMIAAAFFAACSLYVIRRTAEIDGAVGLWITAACVLMSVLTCRSSDTFSMAALTLTLHVFMGTLAARVSRMIYDIIKAGRAAS